MVPLRIGVVGVGQRAQLAMHVMSRKDASVVAAADTSPVARQRARDLFGADVLLRRDYRELLDDDLDAVLLFTPDNLHAEPAIEFLRAKVPVFVEKPLAISTEDCDRILEVAMTEHVPLYVGHNLRHAPVVRAMKSIIDQGRIGNVKAVWCRHFVAHGGDFYFKDWHAERRNTTGLLLQKGAHDIDIIHWLAGGACRLVVALGGLEVYGSNTKAKSVEASDRRLDDWYDESTWPPSVLMDVNPTTDVEDISMMLGRMDNQVFMSYEQCHFTPDYWRNYTVIGDSGRVENFGDLEGASVRVWNSRRSGYRADADYTIEIDPAEGDHGGADKRLIDEFIGFVRSGGTTETSPVAAREAVATGVAATASLRAGGQPVVVDPPDVAVAAYFARHQV